MTHGSARRLTTHHKTSHTPNSLTTRHNPSHHQSNNTRHTFKSNVTSRLSINQINIPHPIIIHQINHHSPVPSFNRTSSSVTSKMVEVARRKRERRSSVTTRRKRGRSGVAVRRVSAEQRQGNSIEEPREEEDCDKGAGRHGRRIE